MDSPKDKKKSAREAGRKKQKKVQTRRTTTPRGQAVIVWQEPRPEPAQALAIPACLEGHRVRRLVQGEPEKKA